MQFLMHYKIDLKEKIMFKTDLNTDSKMEVVIK